GMEVGFCIIQRYLQFYTARYFNTLPVDPSAVFAAQKSDHPADVFRQPDTAERRHVTKPLVHVCIIPDTSAGKIGCYRTGSNDIHPYPARSQLQREVTCKCL